MASEQTIPSFVELASSNARRIVRKYTVAERKMYYEKWQKSGLSMNEYCHRSGLLISTFSTWVKKIKGNPPIATDGNLENRSNDRKHPTLEIVLLSGIRLRFAEITNIAEVLRLVKALESCS